jgi:hypothetical protein
MRTGGVAAGGAEGRSRPALVASSDGFSDCCREACHREEGPDAGAARERSHSNAAALPPSAHGTGGAIEERHIS